MIESRKRADNAYKEMDTVIADTKKILQIANFEIHSAAKIEQLTKSKEQNQHRGAVESALDERRQQLADLFNYEIEQWRGEAMSMVETQEDRKTRIMAKAYALRDAREAGRNELVKKKYDLQWRDACDDARTLDSKAMTQYMNKERLTQIEEKKARRERLTQQEGDFLSEWTKQMDKVEAQDLAKQAYRRRNDAETSVLVRKQMDENVRLKAQFNDRRLAEEQEDLERLRREVEADEAAQRVKQESAYARGRAVLDFNAEFKVVRGEEEAVEREQDAMLLDYAIRKEGAKQAEEDAKRSADRNAAVQYRRYLEEQMVREAEDTMFVDEIRKREEEKVFKARDDALQARDDARSYLAKMVDEGRQEQIRAKRATDSVAGVEGQVFAAKFIEDAKEAVRAEARAAEARRDLAVDNQGRLQSQMDYRRFKEEAEKQETYLEVKQMKYMERQHQARLTEQAGAVRTFRPLQKNNWYS